MKNILTVILLASFSALVSCGKGSSYYCSCKDSNGLETDNYKIKSPKAEAIAECEVRSLEESDKNGGSCSLNI